MSRTKLLTLTLALAACAFAAPAFGQFDIVGTVSGNAAPVDSVEIRLFTDTGIPIGIPLTYTNALGVFTISGLPNGGYLLQYRPPTATSLVAAERLVTVAGANANADIALAPGFILSGFVRDGDGVPIPSIDLQAYDKDTGNLMLTPGDDTDVNGFYDVVLPAGEYDLEWRSVGVGALPYIPFTDTILLEAPTQYDVVLHLGRVVAGTITDSFGAPVPNVNLDFLDALTGAKANTPGDNTAGDGTYAALVPLGTWDVVAKPAAGTRLLPGFHAGIIVAADVSGVDFVLEPGHLVSGVVTGPGAVPVEGVNLDVNDAVTGATLLTPNDVTDPAGFYQIVLPAGTYDVGLTPPLDTMLAPKVILGVVVVGETALNSTLQAGVIFSGTVTGGGQPVPGTDIDLKDAVTGLNLPLTGDGTDQTGAFSTVVAPGTYILEVEPPYAAGLVAHRDSNFVLTGNVDLPFVLAAGARVTGTVTTSYGQPLPDVNVDALRTADGTEIFTPGDHTNTLGYYRMVVPADTYDFRAKLGLSYAVRDSVFVTTVVITGDEIVDIVFSGGVSAVEDVTPALPAGVLRAAPNPFNPATQVAFTVTHPGRVRVAVHGLDGRLVRVLADQEFPVGQQTVTWNGKDEAGRGLASGVYVVAATGRDGVRTTKVSLVK